MSQLEMTQASFQETAEGGDGTWQFHFEQSRKPKGPLWVENYPRGGAGEAGREEEV